MQMDTTVQISKDTYAWTETRKLLTRDQTCTPNLISFGYMTNTRSTEPLNCHIHPNAYEFVIVVKGTQRYEAGGQSYPLVGGDVFVSLRGEPHEMCIRDRHFLV